MPANAQSLAVSDRYRQMMSRLATAATAIAAARWTKVRQEDLDSSYKLWLAAILPVVIASQRSGATLSQHYAKQYVQMEGQVPTPGQIDPSEFTGSLVPDKTLAEALTPPLFTVKKQIGEGATTDQALRSGLLRAQRSISDHVLFKTRYALDEAVRREPKILGWRRVCQPTACGACLAAATGAIQHEHETLPCHPGCQCYKEPVVEGASDGFTRPNGHEYFLSLNPAAQARLFGGPGGDEVAKLIREGAVPFTALVERQELETGPAWITQSSTESLLAHASTE